MDKGIVLHCSDEIKISLEKIAFPDEIADINNAKSQAWRISH